jgi:hypothetical protein
MTFKRASAAETRADQPKTGAAPDLKNLTGGLAMRYSLLLFFSKTSFASVLWEARG